MSNKSTKSIKGTKRAQPSRPSSTSPAIQDIRSMRTMERYWYVTGNYKVCTCCNEEKRLTEFWNKQNNTINENCKKCNKKLYDIEVMKIVLGVLKKNDVL